VTMPDRASAIALGKIFHSTGYFSHLEIPLFSNLRFRCPTPPLV
jgi:hypothetical protein